MEDSLRNLGAEEFDLLQLHCPPRAVYENAEVFRALDRMVSEGKPRHYGVRVETVEEALRGMEWPNVKTIQIIVNMFPLKPLLTRETAFAKDDHRNFNRHGEAFEAGETFSCVDSETGCRPWA